MTLKFYYNGIKDNGGRLQKCWFSNGPLINHLEDTITIYKRDHERFSQGVREAFAVQNDTDLMTDYFEKDRIRVRPDHPLYHEVKAAMDKAVAKQHRIHA